MGHKPSKLTKKEIQYLAERTTFSEAQIRTQYETFLKDCPTGVLSKSKFRKIYSTLYPNKDTEEFVEHIFRALDTDNNGTIDFKEFLFSLHMKSTDKPEDKLRWAFGMYDIDGNGMIEMQEMVKIVEAIAKMKMGEDFEHFRGLNLSFRPHSAFCGPVHQPVQGKETHNRDPFP